MVVVLLLCSTIFTNDLLDSIASSYFGSQKSIIHIEVYLTAMASGFFALLLTSKDPEQGKKLMTKWWEQGFSHAEYQHSQKMNDFRPELINNEDIIEGMENDKFKG